MDFREVNAVSHKGKLLPVLTSVRKTKTYQNCERLSRKTFTKDRFSPPEMGFFAFAGGWKQRLHYCPVGLQLFSCGFILGKETLRNKILDRLSWQKNRLGKIQSTMNRKTSSWEILSGVPEKIVFTMKTLMICFFLSEIPKLQNPFEILAFDARDGCRIRT